MPIGTSLGLSLPTPGVTTDWGDEINTALETIAEAVEGQVPSSALDVSSNIAFGGNDITAMGTIQFTNEAAGLTAAGDVRKVYTVSGELYFTDGSQNAIQITSGGALNAAALGGISGAGYGSGGVQVSWDSGTDAYLFKSGSGASDYAKIGVESVKLQDGSGNFLTLDTPSLASGYTITFPAAVPSTTQGVSITSGGVVTFDGAHGSRTLTIHPAAGQHFSADDNPTYTTGAWVWTASNDIIDYPIPLEVGKRITAVTVGLERVSGEINFILASCTLTAVTNTTLCSKNITSGTSATTTEIGTSPTSGSLPQTVETAKTYVLRADANNYTGWVYGINVTYDQL